jgi:MFS family permease
MLSESAVDASPQPSVPRAAWVCLAVLFAASSLSYTDRYILAVLLVDVRRELAISDVGLSLVQGAAFAVVYALASIPLGAAADRTNRRRLILVGVTVWSLGTAGCALAPGFGGLFLARLLVAGGEACLYPAAVSIVGDVFPPSRRGLALGVVLAGCSLGAGLSITIGGALVSAYTAHPAGIAPWRATLLTAAAMGVPLLLGIWFGVPEPMRNRVWGAGRATTGAASRATSGSVPTGVADGGAPSGQRWRDDWIFLWRLRWSLGPAIAGVGVFSIADASVSAWFPTFLQRTLGVSPGDVSARLGPIAIIGGSAGFLAGGVVADWFAERAPARGRIHAAVLAAVLAIPCLAFGLVATPGVSLALYAPFSVLDGVALAAGVTAIQTLVPANRQGFIIAVQAFVYVIAGLGAGPTVVAVVTEGIYKDPLMVGRSLSVVAAISLLVGIPLLLATRVVPSDAAATRDAS